MTGPAVRAPNLSLVRSPLAWGFTVGAGGGAIAAVTGVLILVPAIARQSNAFFEALPSYLDKLFSLSPFAGSIQLVVREVVFARQDAH